MTDNINAIVGPPSVALIIINHKYHWFAVKNLFMCEYDSIKKNGNGILALKGTQKGGEKENIYCNRPHTFV